jgi:hypothetical protein
MFFFIHWGTENTTQNIGNNKFVCPNCLRGTRHTYRLCEDKIKLYGCIPIHTKRKVTKICHDCLSEFKLSKYYEENILQMYEQSRQKIKESIKQK